MGQTRADEGSRIFLCGHCGRSTPPPRPSRCARRGHSRLARSEETQKGGGGPGGARRWGPLDGGDRGGPPVEAGRHRRLGRPTGHAASEDVAAGGLCRAWGGTRPRRRRGTTLSPPPPTNTPTSASLPPSDGAARAPTLSRPRALRGRHRSAPVWTRGRAAATLGGATPPAGTPSVPLGTGTHQIFSRLGPSPAPPPHWKLYSAQRGARARPAAPTTTVPGAGRRSRPRQPPRHRSACQATTSTLRWGRPAERVPRGGPGRRPPQSRRVRRRKRKKQSDTRAGGHTPTSATPPAHVCWCAPRRSTATAPPPPAAVVASSRRRTHRHVTGGAVGGAQ